MPRGLTPPTEHLASCQAVQSEGRKSHFLKILINQNVDMRGGRSGEALWHCLLRVTVLMREAAVSLWACRQRRFPGLYTQDSQKPMVFP